MLYLSTSMNLNELEDHYLLITTIL